MNFSPSLFLSKAFFHSLTCVVLISVRSMVTLSGNSGILGNSWGKDTLALGDSWELKSSSLSISSVVRGRRSELVVRVEDGRTDASPSGRY